MLTRRWNVKVRVDGRMKEVMSGVEGIDIPTIKGFSPDGKSLWIAMGDNGSVVYRPISLADGKLGDPIADANGRELSENLRTGRVMLGTSSDVRERTTFYDERLASDWETIERQFPDSKLRFVAASDDANRVVFESFDYLSSPAYLLYDAARGSLLTIASAYQGLPVLGETRVLQYAAADGLKIPAVLALPRAVAAQNLPLIVLVHGGPEAHDSDGFDWWSEALVAQGYAVLRANYRGSDSSAELFTAGFGQWGRKMQSDLSDGVAMLVRAGLVDSSRVCIVGASYGGYAALAGITQQSGIYRCAVSVSGIADLDLEFGTGSSFYPSQRYIDRYLGTDGRTRSVLQELSPINHVAAVTAPLLLVHGRNDGVVHYLQSERMAKAMKSAGKPVEFVTLPGEDHWLSRSDTRLQMLQAVVAFLRAHNPPGN